MTEKSEVLDSIKNTIKLAEEWAKEQILPESAICISALKDIRRKINQATSEDDFVWLNIETGEFSNSFSEEDVKEYMQYVDPNPKWKLIRYKCVNDEFQFSRLMKLK